MIIVLKHGNMKYFQVCPHCNCEFLYEYRDISLMSTGNGTMTEQLQCPECYHIMKPNKIKYNSSQHIQL